MFKIGCIGCVSKRYARSPPRPLAFGGVLRSTGTFILPPYHPPCRPKGLLAPSAPLGCIGVSLVDVCPCGWLARPYGSLVFTRAVGLPRPMVGGLAFPRTPLRLHIGSGSKSRTRYVG